LNEVIVRWPIPEFYSDEDLSAATSDLCQHRLPSFYPIFGEIHSFIVASNGQLAKSPHARVEVAISSAVA
jgi:hypothetical protein